MAKMFYTLEEVSQKLGRSEDDVKEMARSGQLQEFRDRDRLMFKVEQIDLLAGGEEDDSAVHLELDDSASSGLALEANESSTLGLADSREDTGISVFDTDHTGTEDAAADASDGGIDEDELNLDEVGSGSGLLDLTRESDDTALGADLLEEVYSSDENVEIPAHASGLFEAAGLEKTEEVTASAPIGATAMPMVVEAYDGTGSGFSAGLLIGAVAALVVTGIITVVGTSGATSDLASKFSADLGTLWMWVGGLAGITIVLGLIGLFIGKASE